MKQLIMSESGLEIRNLRTEFFTQKGAVQAIRGVSLTVRPGETVAVVGESGSGKSVTALSAMRLIPPSHGRTISGQVLLGGRDLLSLSEREMRSVRGKQLSMIFQEAMTSLNPVRRIGDQIAEAILAHERVGRAIALKRALELLAKLRIPEPERIMNEYPHRLSGGMRQRVMIAIAVAGNPLVLIADEPTTALDVTIQAQILSLLDGLRRDLGMGLLLVTHDLGVVAEMADRIVVMYAGTKVEEADVGDFFREPKHPYSQGLLGASPRIDAASNYRENLLVEIPGMVPALLNMPSGCAFADRCPRVMVRCRTEIPTFVATDPTRGAACFAVPSELGHS
jgi:peptide/nickel transport system ATP-binding protein